MNATRLLEYYDRIAEAPDAISRLRHFILDLAMRGKLVPQDPKDEPASELLKRIEKGRTRLGDGRKITPVIESSFMSDSISGVSLPRGWVLARVGEVASVVMGQSPPGHTYNKSGEGVPLINGPLEFSTGPFGKTVVNQYTSAPRVFCEEGDLLICVRGSTTGRTNIAGFRACIGRGVAAIRSHLDGVFTRLFIWSARDAIIGMGRGIAFPSVSRKQIEDLAFPVPPLAEQRRIVAKVDELMALCDRLQAARTNREATRERLTAASLAHLNAPDPDTFGDDVRFALDALPAFTVRPDQIKQLRQTILNLAVRGKLVPQDPMDGTGSELISSLNKARERWETAGRNQRKKGGYAVVLDDEKYLELPSSWAWARLTELGQTQTGTTPSSANTALFGNSIPFIKPADLDGNEINYDGPGLSEAGMEHARLAPVNSVMMVCIGATLGKVNKTTRPVCFNQQINCLTPYLDGLSDYLALALRASGFQALAWTKAGTGTLPIISKGKWELLPIPLPPLPEQYRIVAKVGELMEVCDRLEAILTTAEETRRRLLEALLHEALAPSVVQKEAA